MNTRIMLVASCCGIALSATASSENAANLKPEARPADFPRLIDYPHPQVDPRNPVFVDDALTASRDTYPVIMAGSAAGAPPDSPATRVDINVPTSNFKDVCSVRANIGGNIFTCSGTPISRRHILTAAHCYDINDDGVNDANATVQIVYFNDNGAQSTTISNITAIYFHPDYTGFNNPVVNDDLAILELDADLPAHIDHFPLYRGMISNGQNIELVGYGDSGFGDVGFTIPPSFSVKRHGRNLANNFGGDDEAGGMIEVWRFDFDGPVGNGVYGGPTLGNNIETTLGGGDSGGPGFIMVGAQRQLYSVNTFGFGFGGNPDGTFGSGGGGMLVNAYLDWIDPIIDTCILPADLTGDGVVNAADLGAMLGTWGPNMGPADLTGDGQVNAADLGQLLGSWGQMCP